MSGGSYDKARLAAARLARDQARVKLSALRGKAGLPLVVSKSIADLTHFELLALRAFKLAQLFVLKSIDAAPPAGPPKVAQALASFFVPPKHREAFMGDLEEAFEQNTALIGIRAARLSYWWHVVTSAVMFLGPRLAAISGIAALVRRFSGG